MTLHTISTNEVVAELQVLQRVADGASLRQTAAYYGVPITVIYTLVRHAKERFSAHTRTQAIADLLRCGLLH